jgi:hypothetical protein
MFHGDARVGKTHGRREETTESGRGTVVRLGT